MDFPVVGTAERDRELVAHPATQCSWLRRSKMMRIGRLSAADQASLRGDELEVRFVALAPGLTEHENAGVSLVPRPGAFALKLPKRRHWGSTAPRACIGI